MKNYMDFVKNSVTLGCFGYLPASGTWGSLCALPFVYFISGYSFAVQAGIIVLFTLISYGLIHRSLPHFSEKDPSVIILDEFVGCCITFFCIPLSLTTIVAGFLLFRFFDIVKPLGIAHSEKLPGALGILLDDFCAGLLANIIIWYLFV